MPGEPRPYWLPGTFASARGGAGVLHAQLLQDKPQRASPGEPELQQVGADKGSEPQPVAAVKSRARLHAERERYQDEAPCKRVDQVVDGHGNAPIGQLG